MSDLVKRLRDYALDDHERGCKGREYDCSCGYDGKRDVLLGEATARIEALEAALKWIIGCTLTEPELMVAKARAALDYRKMEEKA